MQSDVNIVHVIQHTISTPLITVVNVWQRRGRHFCGALVEPIRRLAGDGPRA